MSSAPVVTPEETPGSTGRRAAVGFAARFAIIAGVFLVLYGFPYAQYGMSQAWLDVYLGSYAKAVGWVLGLVEGNVQVVGTGIFGKASLQIVRSCDAMEINILLAAAILAFPGPPLKKALALALGLAGVALLNVTRIVTLYYVLLGRQGAFEFLHLELWPLVMVVAAAALFIGATRFLRVVPEPNRL
jgi:exosortase/archaeosortase family protein